MDDTQPRVADIAPPRLAMVTGAAGLIGRWIIDALVEDGMSVLAIDSRAAADRDLGPVGRSVVADLREENDIQGVMALAGEIGVPIGVLVNNAGLYPSGALEDVDTQLFDDVWSVNVRAPFLLMKHVAAAMVAAGTPGTIINMSSGASQRVRMTYVPYCVSKTALDRLSRGFAMELARYGIRVNCIEPGFATGSEVSELSSDHVAYQMQHIPLGRQTTPSDIAGVVRFLLSQAAQHVTGTTIAVDGGSSAGTVVPLGRKAP